jgi:uncharacterized protein
VPRLADRAFSKLFRLTPPNDFTVERGVRVPMRDGAELLADHFIPATANPAGTILIRAPYGRRAPFTTIYARPYAAHGYHVVLQSVRGTFGSGGDFEPMINEIDDGADTVDWLRRQPWFTGSFATVGLSYLGFTQWALLMDPPPELAAAVITVGPHDFSAATWGSGSFTVGDFLGWCQLVLHQEDGTYLQMALKEPRTRRRLARALGEVPLGEAGRTLLGTGAPWYEAWLEHSDRADTFWEQARLGAALDRVAVPVLLIGGWQDIFLEQTIEQYRHLRDRGVEAALTIGPWSHADLIGKGAGTVVRQSLDWLGAHLGGKRSARKSAVRVHIGGRGWLYLPDWPPATSEHVFHLRPGGALGETAPPMTAAPSSFRYDPADPTPSVGGRVLNPAGGYRNDSSLARRADVLSFTTAELTTDLEIIGTPVVELLHDSDNPHVDLFVRLSEVAANGRSRNVSEGFRRLEPAPGPRHVRLTLDAIAHRFPAGSRIRLVVAGGSHPRFARNTGTGEPPITAKELVPAVHTVHYGSSRLVLPIT